MKEFNLEEAKAGKAVSTRNGRPARIICFDRKNDSYPILSLITTNDNHEECLSYTIDGKFDGRGKTDNLDLMMVAEKKEGWINIYSDHTRSYEIFDTEEEAKKYMYGRGTTIKITWEE